MLRAQTPGMSTDQPPRKTTPLDRRDFIRKVAVATAATQFGLGAALSARGEQSAAPAGAAPAPKAPANNCVGIQMGPHTLLDEGIEKVMDLLQETAAINTLFVY